MLAIVAGAAMGAPAHAEGLTGLDKRLNETGRIGTLAPPSTPVGSQSPDAGAATSPRDPASALARIGDDAQTRAAAPPTPSVPDDAELVPTDSAVADCRVEVARRRRVRPAKVPAGTVVIRFTIERSGRVHGAEALSAPGTDLEVAACAKRVLSEWVFAKRVKDATVVERTYRFARPG